MVIERMDAISSVTDQFKEGLSEMDNSMLQEERKASGKNVLSKLLTFLIRENYKNNLKFLQLLEHTGQSHMLNYIISDSGNIFRVSINKLE